MCHEVLVRLRRGRRKREVIQEAWRKRRTVLGHRWSRLRRGRDRRNRPWRNRHDRGWRARHYWSLSWWRSGRTLGGRGQLRNRTTQARRGRWFVLTITPQVIHAEKNNGKPGLRTGIHHKWTKTSVKLGKLKVTLNTWPEKIPVPPLLCEGKYKIKGPHFRSTERKFVMDNGESL